MAEDMGNQAQRLGADSTGLTRRRWLGAQALAGLHWLGGRGMAGAEHPPAGAAAGFGRAKSVIVVFANGGQSQLETWDPKPDAPREVRGAFEAISTAVPGVQFTEHLPQVARIADRLCVVRSMSHDDVDHGSAVYLALTGTYHPQRSSNPPPSPRDTPTLGAVLRRVWRGPPVVHEAVHVNGPALLPTEPGPGQDGGFLGRAFEPLLVGDVIGGQGGVAGLSLAADVPLARLGRRLDLLKTLEQGDAGPSSDTPGQDFATLCGRAYAMLASARTREAFELKHEPATVRQRYGLNRSGQALLLARRLVEAGVPLVNVIWNQSNRGQDHAPSETDSYGWDTHNDIFAALKDRLLPRFDEGFSALVEDLDERGLLDETLVVCMGEFGRAPRVALERSFAGTSPGRKHWPRCYSIVAAGAGVQRGAVVGASDRMGAEPADERFGPWDLAATLFHALGIPPEGHYHDALERPFAVSLGSPIERLYG
jgi:hypothetical protein